MPSRGIRGYVAYAGEKLEQHFPLLHRNLRPDFHDSIRRKLKIAAARRRSGQEDEQPVLPKWHARATSGLTERRTRRMRST